MTSTDLHTHDGHTDVAAGEHKHPSDRQYVIIAVILAVITAAEVATYALDFFFPGRKTTSGNAFELWVDDVSFIVQ